MKILQVIPFFSPQMGGSCQAVYHTARNLGARGHAVTVLTGDYAQKRARFPRGPFSEVCLPSRFGAAGLYLTPGLAAWAAENLPRFDILHLHIARTYQNVVLHSAARRCGVPYIITAHGTLPRIDRRQAAKRVFDLAFGRSLFRDAAGWVAVTPVEAEQYRSAGIAPDRIRVIGDGLDLAEYADPPRPGLLRTLLPGVNPKARLLLALSRLHKIKGLDFLIEGFSLLPAGEIPEYHLAIVGPDEGELARLQALARRLGVGERVHFPGPVYGPDRLRLFADADLFLSTSRYEITGLTSFEALMCGAPVLVTRESGQGRLIEEAGAGYLVSFGDAEGLADAIRGVFADRRESQRRVRAGRTFVRRRMDWRKKADELIGYYRQILPAPKGEPRTGRSAGYSKRNRGARS